MSIFSRAERRRIKRNVFRLDHENILSLNIGDAVPILCQEVVPGDSFKNQTEIFIRFAPMLAPVMHRIDCYTAFFFVPNRLVYDGWKEGITGGEDGTTPLGMPTITANNIKPYAKVGSLADYLSVPPAPTTGTVPSNMEQISLLPFRAYQLIYNEYIRDQNLQDEIDFSKGSTYETGDLAKLFTLRKINYAKDYFTSALPWPQRGPVVALPSSTGVSNVYLDTNGAPGGVILKDSTLQPITGHDQLGVNQMGNITANIASNLPTVLDPNGTLKVDLSTVSNTTIVDLRNAMALQEWYETNARGGSRYIEQIEAHFGVTSSDARLQRPEFLGGGKSPVVISEVLQQSATTDSSPQGNMAGRAVVAGRTHSFKRFFEEHGYIIGIMYLRPKSVYMDGLPRHFQKTTREDFFWPEFQHIGEQEIKNSELYLWGANPDGTFGYGPRYAEYKFAPNEVHGEMRTSLDYWHLARKFGETPPLNSEFIEVSDEDTQRIFNVIDPSVHKIYAEIYFNESAKRPMDKYGTPGFRL